MLSGPSFGKYVVEQFSVDDSAADTVPFSLDIVVLVADPFELHVSNYVDQGEKWRAAEGNKSQCGDKKLKRELIPFPRLLERRNMS